MTSLIHTFYSASTWGVEVPITNPGAESSFATGWSQFIGTSFAVVSGTFDSTHNPGLTAHAGTYSFGAGTAQWAAAENIVDISGILSSAIIAIDGGTAKVTLDGWLATEASGIDWGGFDMHFLDASSNWLGGMAYDLAHNSNVWTKYSHTEIIPQLTRKIGLRMRGYRSGGDSKINAFFDDLAMLIVPRNDGKQHKIILSEKGDSLTGWTSETNTLITAVTGTSNSQGGAWGVESGLRWGSGASTLGRAYKEIAIGAFGWNADIDAGSVSVIFNWKQINGVSTPQASGRVFVEAVDGSNAVLSRTYSEATPVQKSITGSGDRQMVLVLPATSRRLRFGIEGTRLSGTSLSQIFANFLYLSAFLEK